VREIDVLVQHTGPGAPIEVSGARVDSTGAFVIISAANFPALLASGEQMHLTVRLDPNVTPGDHAASLLLQATSCADQPLHLHAAVTDPGPGTPDAGSGSPDAGSPAPDAGSGPVGSSGSSSTDSAKGGGCSSGPAPVEALALAGLAAVSLRRRRRPAA
jgi:MYXO-CTERM domain-containing protein